MKGRFMRGLAAGFFAVVVTAAILEAAIRVLHLIPDNVPIPYRQLPGDENFGPAPSESARSLYGVAYHTDSRGLRGSERPLARAVGQARVAVLGDSVVWGFGLAEETTIPAWLERLAEDRRLNLDAWNLGVVANNLYNERARYARLAPTIRPDVTIVVVLFNDLEPEPDRVRVTPERTLANIGRRAPYPDSWRPVLELSALFQAAVRVYVAVFRDEDRVFNLANLPGALEQLDQIRAIAGSNGSALIVAAMPGPWPDSDRFGRLSEALRQFCVERQLAFVDLSSTLEKPVRREYFQPADSTHPSAAGARLVAEALLARTLEALQRRPVTGSAPTSSP